MSKKLFIAATALAFACTVNASAQNTSSPAQTAPPRPATRRPAPRPTPTPATGAQQTTPAAEDTTSEPATTRTRRTGTAQGAGAATTGATAAERAVRATFETLLNGIRKSDVEMVMSVYWNSPQLVIFNNNGTVTRSWEQVRANRASSYPDAKNVQLDVRDVRVSMLGAGGAIVTCLWTQSQEFRGTPESAQGRLTVVFRLINNGWKIVHTHTSPSAPDPSRLLPSEQPATPPASDGATRPPAATRP
ncbi:MAG TPA: nuclear transport factor 2 family protein [Pyrinomonadaceae bacterium]|nr:nuclear transport factor 2 family protein [Pyrinomonadaceae bacterium]